MNTEHISEEITLEQRIANAEEGLCIVIVHEGGTWFWGIRTMKEAD